MMQFAITPPAEIFQQQETRQETGDIGQPIPADPHGITEAYQEWAQVVQVISDHCWKRTPSWQEAQACCPINGVKVPGAGSNLYAPGHLDPL